MEYLTEYTVLNDIKKIKKIVEYELGSIFETWHIDLNCGFSCHQDVNLNIFNAFSVACAIKNYEIIDYYCASIKTMYYYSTYNDYDKHSNIIEPFNNIRNNGNIFKFACRNNDLDIINYLENISVKLNLNDEDDVYQFDTKTMNEGFIEACCAGNIKIVKYLVKKYNINMMDKYILNIFHPQYKILTYIVSYCILQYKKSHPDSIFPQKIISHCMCMKLDDVLIGGYYYEKKYRKKII